jgi:hypothetical protein
MSPAHHIQRIWWMNGHKGFFEKVEQILLVSINNSVRFFFFEKWCSRLPLLYYYYIYLSISLAWTCGRTASDLSCPPSPSPFPPPLVYPRSHQVQPRAQTPVSCPDLRFLFPLCHPYPPPPWPGVPASSCGIFCRKPTGTYGTPTSACL